MKKILRRCLDIFIPIHIQMFRNKGRLNENYFYEISTCFEFLFLGFRNNFKSYITPKHDKNLAAFLALFTDKITDSRRFDCFIMYVMRWKDLLNV